MLHCECVVLILMQNAFACHCCQKTFISKTPAQTKYKLKKRGYVFCSKSCASFKHGGFKEKSSEYKSWNAMKTRCNCPGTTHYHRYGGRGISYQESWESFEEFLKDMGPKPDSKMELDRIDNDKNYTKDNCRWATRKEQTRNRSGKRATRLYTYNGKTMCIADWAKEVGISASSMQKRLNKGWPLEIAFNPIKRDKLTSEHWVNYKGSSVKGKTVYRKNSKYITIGDETKTYAEWEREKGLSRGLISKRLSYGYSEYDAVMLPKDIKK